MNPSEEFLRHAADCQKMARLSRDPQSKATWKGMATRWLSCAAWFDGQVEAARREPTKAARRGRALTALEQ